MGCIHQGEEYRSVNNYLINVYNLDDASDSVGETGQGIICIVLDEDGWDEQAYAHQHPVLDEQVVVFRGRASDEDVDRLADEKSREEIEQDAQDDEREEGDDLGQFIRVGRAEVHGIADRFQDIDVFFNHNKVDWRCKGRENS